MGAEDGGERQSVTDNMPAWDRSYVQSFRSFALVRDVPESFAHALCGTAPAEPIDAARARAQHAEYVAALSSLGLEIVRVAADEACPDCCFVEDAALVAGGTALVTRSAAPSRRGEADAVAAALAGRLEVARMTAPATLDGGDCLRLGRRLFVGRSARTNGDGVAALRAVFPDLEVVEVALPPGALHLKSVCSPLAADLVLLADHTIPPAVFAPASVVMVPAAEAHAANAVVHGGRALVAAGAPRAQAVVEAAGLRVIAVDTSELRKADGALTCLSIVVA
jgi:dimethylargininase